MQLNYQRPYRKGVGFQVFYVLSRAFRVGGNTFRDNLLYPASNYAPGTLPADMPTGTLLEPSKEFNKFQNYKLDTAIPLHRLTFNGIVDIPVGKGKRFLGDSNKWVNALVGGYQMAFVGTMVSQAFQVSSINWGAGSPIERYKDSIPITDCRSGVCRPGNLWFNGYIAPNLINTPNGVQGIPESYQAISGADQQYSGHNQLRKQQRDCDPEEWQQVLTPFFRPVYSTNSRGCEPILHNSSPGPRNFQPICRV